jgi:hypothetical protein
MLSEQSRSVPILHTAAMGRGKMFFVSENNCLDNYRSDF